MLREDVRRESLDSRLTGGRVLREDVRRESLDSRLTGGRVFIALPRFPACLLHPLRIDVASALEFHLVKVRVA